MDSHTPADDNWERYRADIKRNKDSFQAYYKDHANGIVSYLIEYLAEAMAYQYSLNRKYEKMLFDIHKEAREEQKKSKL